MSASSDRGLAFERVVRKMTARVLKLDIKRDLQSGAGIHKQDIRDRFNELPIFIECKDHQTIKPKEWWRDANNKAVAGEAPVVVFPDNEEVLCVMRYSDLLNLIKEGFDWRETAEDYRTTPVFSPNVEPNFSEANGGGFTKIKVDPSKPSSVRIVPDVNGIPTDQPVEVMVNGKLHRGIVEGAVNQCLNGHIVIDDFGHCQVKGCQYSRGYVKKIKARSGFNNGR